MVTVRIRVPREDGGVIWGVRVAAKKYNLHPSLIGNWVKVGEVKVLDRLQVPGGPLPIDEDSLRRRIIAYSPHRDNQARRGRRRTIPEMQSPDTSGSVPTGRGGQSRQVGTVNSNGHQTVVSRPRPGSGFNSGAKVYRVPVGALAGDLPEGVKPQLETKPWVEAYYESKRDGLRPKTQKNYDLVFGRFKEAFSIIPLDRRVVLDYIEGLKGKYTRRAMDDSGKGHHLQTIVTFYAWLHREYGYNVPDLTEAGLVDKGETALPIYSHEIRATLAQCRNRTEADLIIVLAQTGIRLGELCSIRPEFLHDHWMEVWGKPTKVNKSGYRQVPVPNEAYRRLQVHWEYNGELVWQDHYGINHPLAGPVEKADPESRRAINLEEPRNLASPPRTFRVQPAPGAEGLVKYFLHQRVMEAGVYEPGKAAQSFRRAYTDEALKNAEGTDGAKMMIDRILGHFSKKDMSSLYHHTTIDRMVAWAERYAPRSFLGEAGEQGKLSLAKEG